MITGEASLGAEERAVVELVDSLLGEISVESASVETTRRTLAEHGLWTPGAAESVGGAEAALRTVLLTISRMARYWPALALASAHAHVGTMLLASESGRQEMAQAVCAGANAAIVDGTGLEWNVTEDNPRCNGDVPRIDVGAPDPMLLVTHGDAVAVVSPDAAGVGFGPVTSRTGLAGAATRSVRLTDAELTELPNAPVRRASTVLRWCIAAVGHGILAAAADAADEYTRQRYQFGAPIRDIPTVDHAVRRCTERASAGAHALLSATEGDPAAATAVAQSTVSESVEIATTAIQLHGGYGYLTEYPVERLLRDAISLRAAAYSAR